MPSSSQLVRMHGLLPYHTPLCLPDADVLFEDPGRRSTSVCVTVMPVRIMLIV